MPKETIGWEASCSMRMAEVKAAMVTGPKELQTLWMTMLLKAIMENWTDMGNAMARCCRVNFQSMRQSSL